MVLEIAQDSELNHTVLKHICDWLWENPPLTHKDK